jgi:ATP-dependent DNA ligase
MSRGVRGIRDPVVGLGVSDEADAHARLAPLVGGPGFTGTAPAGRSRWSGRERLVVPVQPKYVVEVSADHIEDGRFRHGSRLLRWRDDKQPEACTMEQIGSAVQR